MEKFKNACVVLVLAVLLALLLGAAQHDEGKEAPTASQVQRQDALVQALGSLAKATERQAIAWEKLAGKGGPVPVTNQFAGGVPSRLEVTLGGEVAIKNTEKQRSFKVYTH